MKVITVITLLLVSNIKSDIETCKAQFSHSLNVCGLVEATFDIAATPEAWCTKVENDVNNNDRVLDFCRISPCESNVCENPIVRINCFRQFDLGNEYIAKKKALGNQQPCKLYADEDCIRKREVAYSQGEPFDYEEAFENYDIFLTTDQIDALPHCCVEECRLRF